MSFDVSADAYNRFMGRFSEPLARQFADLADLGDLGDRPGGRRVLDVGCGPGALTSQLVQRLGAGEVAAVDPSESFVEAARLRFPDVDVRRGTAEHLPFDDDAFEAAFAQLVVHFMADPIAGLAEMSRVTRPGGLVLACVWDHADGGAGPLSPFWKAIRSLDPDASSEAHLMGTQQGQLAELFAQAGLADVDSPTLTVRVGFATFDEWWEPYTLGVGPAGAHVAGLDDAQRERLRARCAELLPAAPFEVAARAWCVRARV